MTNDPSLDSTAEAAIARVLDAERAAREALERAAVEGTAMVEAARAQARAIRDRTDRRIARIRQRFAAHKAREIAAIEGEIAVQDNVRELDQDDLVRVGRAVAALAAELTTSAPGAK